MKKINTNDLIKYLNDIFPQRNSAEWDKIGFQIEEVYNLPSQDEIENIIVCLDVTKEVLDFAIENKSNLIICRHPFFFNEIEEELKDKAKKKMHEKLIENEIQIFSIHTNYDSSEHQSVIEIMETQLNIKEHKRVGENNEGLKIKLFNELTLRELFEKLKFVFGSTTAKVSVNSDYEKLVNSFSICTGAGSSMMIEELMTDCVFITGEAKWSDFVYASNNNVDLVALGHYMENYFIDDIKNKIEKTFGDQVSVKAFDIKNTWKTF